MTDDRLIEEAATGDELMETTPTGIPVMVRGECGRPVTRPHCPVCRRASLPMADEQRSMLLLGVPGSDLGAVISIEDAETFRVGFPKLGGERGERIDREELTRTISRSTVETMMNRQSVTEVVSSFSGLAEELDESDELWHIRSALHQTAKPILKLPHRIGIHSFIRNRSKCSQQVGRDHRDLGRFEACCAQREQIFRVMRRARSAGRARRSHTQNIAKGAVDD